MLLCFLELASIFLLARFGRKTDGHNKHAHVFLNFLCFFLHRQGLTDWHIGLEGFQQKRQLFNLFDTAADDDILNESSLS
jgi:hypothetical protein